MGNQGGAMKDIPNVDELTYELQDYYPKKMATAISYMEIQYELDTLSAIQIVSVVWNTLHLQSPFNLPHFLVNPQALFMN